MQNSLYYGDNLLILRNREYFPNDCVDLIYLDPPFNSNRDYNVLFKAESGSDSEAQKGQECKIDTSRHQWNCQ